MKLYALGVGDAFTTLYHTTCAAVQAGGRTLLIDCPHPIRRVFRDAHAPFDIDGIDGVIITHNHADHVSGLEGLLFFAHFALKRKMPVLGHPDVLDALWNRHLHAGMGELLSSDGSRQPLTFEDFAEPIFLDPDNVTPFAGFDIRIRQTIHHIPTFALRIASHDAQLGWSSDTSFDPTLIDWLAQADRFVHETNYGVHTPYASLLALPDAIRAKMWINHYPDDFDVDGSAIEPLRQGTVYPVVPVEGKGAGADGAAD